MSETKTRFFYANSDAGILPAGIKAHDCPSGNCPKGKGVTYPVEALPDMIVFYKKSDGYSIDPSATPTTPGIIMGQYKADKNGVIVEILKIIGDSISCDNIESMNAVTANAGRGEQSRLMWTCSKKNTIYGFNVDITSNRTRQEFAMNKPARYPVSYDTTLAAACDSCDDTTVCRTIACGIVDMFNGTMSGDETGFIPYKEEPKPVKAYVINPIDYVFCLDGVEEACGECTSYTGIKGINIQGELTYFNTLNSATTTAASQLQKLADEITCAFNKHQGFAYIGGGTISGACVSLQLIVNSCMSGVQLIKADGSYLAPCYTNPVTLQKLSTKNCVNCGETNALTTTYNCGIGFSGELAEEVHGIEGGSDYVVNYYPTNVNVNVTSGFVDHVFEVTVPAISPEGFGAQLYDMAYRGDIRPGFYDHQRRTGGEFNHLMEKARSKQVELKQHTPYCVISWEANAYGHWTENLGFNGSAYVSNVFFIPQAYNMKEALVADLNALKNVNNFRGIADIACTADPEPGPPSVSVSSTPFATPTITPSVTKSATPSVSKTATPSISATTSVSPTRSVTPSTSPA